MEIQCVVPDGACCQLPSAAHRVSAALRTNRLPIPPSSAIRHIFWKIRAKVFPTRDSICSLALLQLPLLFGGVDLPKVVNARVRRWVIAHADERQEDDDTTEENEHGRANAQNEYFGSSCHAEQLCEPKNCWLIDHPILVGSVAMIVEPGLAKARSIGAQNDFATGARREAGVKREI